jgi:hypothetical protein
MKKRESTAPAALRARAEDRLKAKASRSQAAGPHSAEEMQRLVHELQVHQIELELQNDELQETRAELEVAAKVHSDLYDFAPVGYLTLDSDGVIQKVNLKLYPTLRVLFMSEYTDDAIGHHGVLDPGTHFIAKPFNAADLTRMVREVLDEVPTDQPSHGSSLRNREIR